jgi:hypothetical protein
MSTYYSCKLFLISINITDIYSVHFSFAASSDVWCLWSNHEEMNSAIQEKYINMYFPFLLKRIELASSSLFAWVDGTSYNFFSKIILNVQMDMECNGHQEHIDYMYISWHIAKGVLCVGFKNWECMKCLQHQKLSTTIYFIILTRKMARNHQAIIHPVI